MRPLWHVDGRPHGDIVCSEISGAARWACFDGSGSGRLFRRKFKRLPARASPSSISRAQYLASGLSALHGSCSERPLFADNRVLIDHWIEQWTQAPARVVYRQGMSWIYKEDLSRQIADIGLPVQIIQGEEEEGLPDGVGPSDAGGPSGCEIGPDTTGRTLCKPREPRCGQ